MSSRIRLDATVMVALLAAVVFASGALTSGSWRIVLFLVGTGLVVIGLVLAVRRYQGRQASGS